MCINEWLQVVLAALTFGATAMLAVITWNYARSTKRMADAVGQQATIAAAMLDELHRAELPFWVLEDPDLEAWGDVVFFNVLNDGGGPARRIRLTLSGRASAHVRATCSPRSIAVGERLLVDVAFGSIPCLWPDWTPVDLTVESVSNRGLPHHASIRFLVRSRRREDADLDIGILVPGNVSQTGGSAPPEPPPPQS